VFGQVDEIVEKSTVTLESVQRLLSPTVIQNISRSSEQLLDALTELTSLAKELRGATENIQQASRDVQQSFAEADLEATFESLQKAARDMEQVAPALRNLTRDASAIVESIQR